MNQYEIADIIRDCHNINSRVNNVSSHVAISSLLTVQSEKFANHLAFLDPIFDKDKFLKECRITP